MALLKTPTKDQLISRAVDIIKTIVFLKVDVQDVNNGHISEISMISVHINELTSQTPYKSLYPRIIDKLTLCFDPLTPYNKHLSCLSKINEVSIKNACKKVFNENACSLLFTFLQRQEGPICFLCHNGFRLDFQILQAELQKLQRTLDDLNGETVYCADSLWTFKTIDECVKNPTKTFKVDVSVFDMVFYTFGSTFARYMRKEIPEVLSAEERNLYLLQLVYHNHFLFFQYLCCKKFFLVKSMKHQTPESSNTHFNTLVDQTVLPVNEIQTYIFIDLETTSLCNAKITELCMIAIHKSSFAETKQGLMPRIQDKILLTFNPGCQIHPKAVELSGLSNDLLEQSSKQTFNIWAVWCIDQFLKQQFGNICFVAHNGDKFDYPILVKTLCSFFDKYPALHQVYCADSLSAMLLKEKNNAALDESQSTQASSQQSTQHKGTKKSFSLINVYKRYFSSSEMDFHNAEDDVIALAKIFSADPSLFNALNQVMKKRFCNI